MTVTRFGIVMFGVVLAACATSPRRAEYVSTTSAVSADIDAKCRQQEAQVSDHRAALAVYDACMIRAGYVPR